MCKLIIIVIAIFIFIGCGREGIIDNSRNPYVGQSSITSAFPSRSLPKGYVILECGCHEEISDELEEHDSCASGRISRFLCDYNCPYLGTAWGFECE